MSYFAAFFYFRDTFGIFLYIVNSAKSKVPRSMLIFNMMNKPGFVAFEQHICK